MSTYARITGTGSFLPTRKLTNADLVAQLAQGGIETSDEWIVERTGIRARHFAADGQMASDLALPAAQAALQMAGRTAGDIDLIIVATSTPDMVFPSTASILQRKLADLGGEHAKVLGCPAFDVQAVCSGFIYGLTVANSMIVSGAAKRVLVVGSEIFSRLLDFQDRTTCVLLAMARAPWCSKPATNPAFWLVICMPMAAIPIFCACPAMSKAGKLWVTRACAWTAKRYSNSPWASCTKLRARCWPKRAKPKPILTG